MKLTRLEVNAVASAALSGDWPPTALFYHKKFGLPYGRAMALERHRFTMADVRRIKGALLRAHPPAKGVSMKCIQEVKSRAIRRVTDEVAAQMVKAGGFKYIPKSQWKAERDKQQEGNRE